MNVTAFLDHLTTQPSYSGQIVHIEYISPREANYAELDEPLVGGLQGCLKKHGLLPLYTHQADAVNNAR